ncbi:MAG: hypothetical protein L0214_05940 [candidate division NC10 bacterium]|nr:hypothetical protein [candidate division NC10 bacterium]
MACIGSSLRRPLIGFLLCLMLAEPAQAVEQAVPLTAAFHVHSTWSTGSDSLDELAAAAERAGIRAVILTENYLARVEYGLLPFRRVFRWSEGVPSLTPETLPVYLAAVREAQARHPGVLLVPGLEVLPHYHWSGSPWNGTLTLHDTQKNLLVVGLDLTALRGLPVAGSTEGVPIRWGLSAAALFGAVVLATAGVYLAGSRRRRRIRLQRVALVQVRRHGLPGLALILLGALLLLNNFPVRAFPFDLYRDAGLAPHRALIRYAAEVGGLTFWSFPEARDLHTLARGPFRITLRTDPYPEDLLATDGYTGFGGIYEDTTTFTFPGGGWDRRLQEFAVGRRSTPGWAVGEAGYHFEKQAGKSLVNVVTVLWVRERTVAGVTEALRAGRGVAVQGVAAYRLSLDRFEVLAGERSAGIGETLVASPGAPVLVRTTVAASDGKAHPVEVLLIRSGEVVARMAGPTPLTLEYREGERAGAAVVFRVEARGEVPHRLLSNPIFVRPGGAGA